MEEKNHSTALRNFSRYFLIAGILYVLVALVPYTYFSINAFQYNQEKNETDSTIKMINNREHSTFLSKSNVPRSKRKKENSGWMRLLKTEQQIKAEKSNIYKKAAKVNKNARKFKKLQKNFSIHARISSGVFVLGLILFLAQRKGKDS